jgi:hypothetical protein
MDLIADEGPQTQKTLDLHNTQRGRIPGGSRSQDRGLHP